MVQEFVESNIIPGYFYFRGEIKDILYILGQINTPMHSFLRSADVALAENDFVLIYDGKIMLFGADWEYNDNGDIIICNGKTLLKTYPKVNKDTFIKWVRKQQEEENETIQYL